MDINKKIVKALLEKNYVDAKESVFNALYAKASLLLDEERVGLAEALFNEDKKMGMYSDGEDGEDKKETKKKTKNEKPSMYEEAEDDKATKTKSVSKKSGKAKGPVGSAVESDGY
ncbi:MAG: hypothetical protein EBR82_46660 [Caulobacteraceae bacterium]|nr:hypothetical protein [Caulobacteraceae bacterium]